MRDPQIPYDPADPCNQPPVVPEPRLPRFEFEFRNEIDLEFLQENYRKVHSKHFWMF